jgi:hypothetical protein
MPNSVIRKSTFCHEPKQAIHLCRLPAVLTHLGLDPIPLWNPWRPYRANTPNKHLLNVMPDILTKTEPLAILQPVKLRDRASSKSTHQPLVVTMC